MSPDAQAIIDMLKNWKLVNAQDMAHGLMSMEYMNYELSFLNRAIWKAEQEVALILEMAEMEEQKQKGA